MENKYISPFKPRKIIKVKSSGFDIYTYCAGFKKFKDDLLIIVFEKPADIAYLFTKSSTPSASVIWNKNYHKIKKCKILIVNSGNANSYTGAAGLSAIKKYVNFAIQTFNSTKDEIFVSSTGIIGEQLNPNLIINKLKLVKKSKTKNLFNAAKSIMTTDTFPKLAQETVSIRRKKIKIYGIAKGSGMIAPNMGTMLSYIFIDASLKKNILNHLLKDNIENSFNSISVDGDMSTNDTVVLFSTGKNILKKINKGDKVYKIISAGLNKIMLNLAKQIVSDGEGITKLIEVNLINAKNKIQAKKIAFSIAESLLNKTAVYGEDPNWGRIIMAIGKTREKINQDNISLSFGNNILIKNGKIKNNININKLNLYMKNKIIKINLDLKIGKYNRTVWSSDLSNQYIKINAEYST